MMTAADGKWTQEVPAETAERETIEGVANDANGKLRRGCRER
jgi:hypothetical protein